MCALLSYLLYRLCLFHIQFKENLLHSIKKVHQFFSLWFFQKISTLSCNFVQVLNVVLLCTWAWHPWPVRLSGIESKGWPKQDGLPWGVLFRCIGARGPFLCAVFVRCSCQRAKYTALRTTVFQLTLLAGAEESRSSDQPLRHNLSPRYSISQPLDSFYTMGEGVSSPYMWH